MWGYTGLSLRFQVAGHITLVGRVLSSEATSKKQLRGSGVMPSQKILKCGGPEKHFQHFPTADVSYI